MAWPLLFMAASAVSSGIAAKKGVPKVAEFTPVDVQGEQTRAIEGNIANLDQLALLSSGSNDIATKNLLSTLEQIQPGYGDMSAKTSSTINSFLAGELPQDVIDQIRRQSAEGSILGGYGPDSGMGRALTARDLGLNTLQLVDRGLSAAQSWMQQSASMAPKFDFSSMFVTPGQAIAAKQQNNEGQQNQQQQQYNMNAQSAAAPWAAASQGLGAMAGFMGGGGAGAAASRAYSPPSTFSYNSPTFQPAGGMFALNSPSLSNAASGQTFASGFYGRN